jgi:hypothetical protein
MNATSSTRSARKLTGNVMIVCAVVVVLAGTHGCKYQAGVKGTTSGDAGTSAAGTSAAGTNGSAGTGAAGTMPFTTGAAGTTVASKPCTNLQCQQSTCSAVGCTQPACPGGARTTVSGKIYDPAGNTPLYNIAVYVPNGPLDDIKDGPTCDPCDPATGTSLLSGQPVVVTKTDESGTFHLGMDGRSDVPAGTNIPLVIQVGKWRRQITVPTVTACMDNPLTDKNQTRLPQTQAEGHIPKIALTTGASDAMECLLLKIGIDKMEFTPEAMTGRVNLYQGGGGAASYAPTLNGGAPFTSATPWWDKLKNLQNYDIVMHSCDGGPYDPTTLSEPAYPKSVEARQALNDFADMGGRVFASHWHAYWFEEGPAAFKSIATFEHDPMLSNPFDATIDQTFDGGRSLAQWMMDPLVMGSTTLGIVTIAQDASKRLIASAAGGNISQQYLYAKGLTPPSVQFLSANTPIPGGMCGKAVISDLHVSAGGGANTDVPKMPFPTGCVTTTLTPREKVLEFMFFDIASCVRPIVQ